MPQTPHEVAAGLRALADWIDAHPAHRPFITRDALTIDIYLGYKENFAALARDMAPCATDLTGNLVCLRKDFGGGVRLVGIIGHAACAVADAVHEWQWDPLLEEGADV
jgi:hypothetical protein